jgi:hypothetical protein
MNSRQPHLWCLYDNVNKRVIEGLLFDEARAVISSLETEVLEHWWAWRDDWADWKAISEVAGLTEIIYRASTTKYPDPSTLGQVDARTIAPQGLHTVQETSLADLSVAKIESEESDISNVTFTLRSSKRFKKRYSVYIELDEKMFKSHTRDISVGGLNLEDPLPSWVQGHFKVRIGKPNNKKQIELKCCLVELDNEERRRIQILPLQKIEDEKALEAWIAA